MTLSNVEYTSAAALLLFGVLTIAIGYLTKEFQS